MPREDATGRSLASRLGAAARLGCAGGREAPGRCPPSWPYALIFMAWAIGALLIADQSLARYRLAGVQGPSALAVGISLVVVGAAMAVGLWYLLGIVAKSACYLLQRRAAPPPHTRPAEAPIAVLYLTAGDFDGAAVDSLLRLRTDGPRLFLLHDDGDDPAARERMRELLENHPAADGWEIAVWHRPRRIGGKAGAVNWVVERLGPRWELMLLCDSDSIALDPRAIQRCAPEFDDPSVAVVQCRNAAHTEPGDPPFHRRLAQAIDVFDALAGPESAWGYVPFMGHNALLRVEDLRRLGGLTPGFFSDDLDFSARLTLHGRRIVYRRDVAFAERHPADMVSFRKRTRKWACGCTQVVRARLPSILTARGIPPAHRIGLVEFMCFYPAMLLLFGGLLLNHLLLPILAPATALPPAVAVAIGTSIVLALLAPTLAWTARNGRLRQWPAFAWACILVYGGSLIPTVRGVLDALLPRERPWVPTNLAEERPPVPRTAMAESLLGFCLVVVPWGMATQDLIFPCTYLFIATLLFSPLTFLAYRQPGQPPARAPRAAAHGALRRRLRIPAAAAAAFVLLLVLATPARADGPIAIVEDRLVVDGAPIQVRAIHYSPWLPGTGPADGGYAPAETVRSDLSRIAALGANTIFIHSAPDWVLDIARSDSLLVIYKFHIDWNDTPREAFDRQAAPIVERAASLRGRDGIIALILGNEVPRWVVDELGADEVSARIRALAAKVREADPSRLLGHANWPVTRELDLSFLDLACFNLYPAWPYEVSVMGFGRYLRDVLVPLAAGKPLLITEFGINTLEAGEQRQAQVIADCWREIDSSPCIGGVVFAWCDEWWKNYDNPIPGRGYWDRRHDPDDAATHDLDPEEHYGIVRADRSPKPAHDAVRRMWAPGPRERRSMVPWVVLGMLGIFTWLAFGLAGRRRTASSPPPSPCAPPIDAERQEHEP